ncbi:MAG: DJ-1 family glyoxalase III [Arenicellales bacterium]
MNNTVLVPLAQGCEELEAITITDLLTRAGVEVITAGLDNEVVVAARGTQIIPDTTLDEIFKQGQENSFDIIVLPGGLPGADNLDQDPRILSMLKQQVSDDKKVAAICAAPKVFANAGLLDGKTATAYPGTLEKLNLNNTRITAEAIEIEGNVITSRGPGTAMDFALTLIEILSGKEKRNEVETALVRT